MGQENLEVVRHAIDAFNREDVEGALEYFHRKVEWLGPVERPGEHYKGHRGIRKLASLWGENFDEHRLDVERLIDVGDEVLVVAYERTRSKGSSETIEQQIGYVWRVRDGGKAERVQTYSSWEAALEEVGMSEQDVHMDAS
jgi:ketosteroid isomerase-like protein